MHIPVPMSEIKSRIQKMYKVGYGPNLWGILSEDSLHTSTYLEGCIEECGERTIYYIEDTSNYEELSEYVPIKDQIS